VIRVGIIGTGSIVSSHLDVLQVADDVSVAAIAGRTVRAREELACRYRIAIQVDDYRRLLRDDRIDAVLVLVAPDVVASVAADALETGRPLFVEKPPGLSVAEALDLAERALRGRVLNMVGLNRRFYSSIAAARRAVDSAGALLGLRIEAPEDLARARSAGRSETVLSRWIYANSIHAIDLLRHRGGPMSSGQVMRELRQPADTNSIVASFEFTAGHIGEYVAHWGSPGPWTVTLYGVDVRVVLSPLEEGVTIDRTRSARPLPTDDVDRQFKPGFHGQLNAFLEMVRSGKPAPAPAADLAEAAASMQLAAWLAGDEARFA
jgi:predicted dehydrogenase